jgi:hypothetical protein
MENKELLNIIKERLVHTSRLDDKSIKEVMEIIADVEADIRHLIEGAIINEKFQIEHGAFDDELANSDCEATDSPKLTHKEDRFVYDFKPQSSSEYNKWLEYGLSEFTE